MLPKNGQSQGRYNWHIGLEGVGLDLSVGPPPHPSCLFRSCLLQLLALLPPQEGGEAQPWGSDQDQAGGGRALGRAAQLRQELD